MSALAEIGPKATDLVVFFEIGWADGSVSTPQVAPQHKRPSKRRHEGRTRFEVPAGALSHQAWRAFRLEIAPLIEQVQDGFFGSAGFDRAAARAVEAIHGKTESFPFPEDVEIYDIPDYFKAALFGLTLERRRVRPEDPAAVRLVVSLPRQRPMMVDAFTSDARIKDLAILTASSPTTSSSANHWTTGSGRDGTSSGITIPPGGACLRP